MLQLETQSQPSPMSQPTTTAILVIGGAEDKVHGKEILHTFWFRSGGTNATIALIPSASREPVLIGERYQSIFEEMGAKYVKVLDIRDRDQGNDPYFKEYVEECTGVFMTGGDQLRLCGLLADTPLMESGESPNRALVDMAMGLGIIPEIIVDQHFHNRNRMSRLLSALSTHPERLGIGIDEDTCALFERDGLMRIVGKGTVTIVDGRDMSYTNQADISATEPLSLHNLRVNILSHGDCYHLHQHQCIAKISSPVQ